MLMNRCQWNSGWTLDLTTDSVNSILSPQGESLSATSPEDIEKITSILLPHVGATGVDEQYVTALKSMTTDDGPASYMGAVSPWFFSHYGPPANTFSKNVSTICTSNPYRTECDILVHFLL